MGDDECLDRVKICSEGVALHVPSSSFKPTDFDRSRMLRPSKSSMRDVKSQDVGEGF